MGKTKRKTPHRKRTNVSLTPDKLTNVIRTHKDKLFRFIFRNKENALKLYNALNDSDYSDVSDLKITTLENVVYLGYKNDVSFLLGSVMTLAEHQSSWNPNMPLRGLPYFSRLYMEYIRSTGLNMYGSVRVSIPFPQYVVFYNGREDRPEREILRLSDSFQKPANPNGLLPEPSVECTALVLNINYGNNRDFMEKCKPLLDYSTFVRYSREYVEEGYTPETAVDLAVERCLSEDIMTEILRVHRKEVTTMFLEDYDEEFYRNAFRKEAHDEGYHEGYASGHDAGYTSGHDAGYTSGRKEGVTAGELLMAALNQKLLADNRLEDLKRASADADFRETLFREYQLS